MDVLRTAHTPEEVQDIGSAAAAFLIDALTSFQMTQRGYLEKARTSTRTTTAGDHRGLRSTSG